MKLVVVCSVYFNQRKKHCCDQSSRTYRSYNKVIFNKKSSKVLRNKAWYFGEKQHSFVNSNDFLMNLRDGFFFKNTL
jgi:hypothetical protein